MLHDSAQAQDHTALCDAYKRIFALRNESEASGAVQKLIALFDSTASVLLRHEVAYALGQMRARSAVDFLTSRLTDDAEDEIVRHEAAEALGAIGSIESRDVLEKYLSDSSCEVAATCALALARLDFMTGELEKGACACEKRPQRVVELEAKAAGGSDSTSSVGKASDAAVAKVEEQALARTETAVADDAKGTQGTDDGAQRQEEDNAADSTRSKLDEAGKGEAAGSRDAGSDPPEALTITPTTAPTIAPTNGPTNASTTAPAAQPTGGTAVDSSGVGYVPNGSVYVSVDPAPPVSGSLDELRAVLLDRSRSMFDRYRAMFALRNLARGRSRHSALSALCECLDDADHTDSPLLKHELAFVLGQLEELDSVPTLCRAVESEYEHPMVRHEAAEALGAIGSAEAVQLLREYATSDVEILSESCIVALHMYDREAFLDAGIMV